MARNTIDHVEVYTRDVKKASHFYSELFGWKMSTYKEDEYIIFQPESGPQGGIQKSEDFTPGNGVVFYIDVDNIEAYLKKAVELGGQQVVARTEVPKFGWFGQFTDPDGNLIGLFTYYKNSN